MKSTTKTPPSKHDQDTSTGTTTDTSTDITTDVKTSTHAVRYFFVGVAITIFNYGLYSILANLIINNNDYLWLSTFISTVITTIVAYFAHSKITWKEREITKSTAYRFFIWNVVFCIFLGPLLTQFFSLITPLYEFTFNVCDAIHLPFTYEFVQSTGAFVLNSLVIMIINFLFYDRFVFPKSTKQKAPKPNPKNHPEE